MAFKRIVFAAVALALLLAGLTGAFLYTHLTSETSARSWVSHTQRVIETNQALFASMRDADAAERGFVIDGDARFLDTYDKARRRIEGAQTLLATLVADNPGEAARVRDLNLAISGRLGELHGALVQAEAGDPSRGRALLHGGASQRTFNAIRDQSDAISSTERQLLKVRVATANRTSRIELFIGRWRVSPCWA